MLGENGPDGMAANLGEHLARWTDRVVPSEVDEIGHNRYSPRYAWMFSYEKSLKYRLEQVLGVPLGNLERQLFGADGVLSEALSNAFVHGHRRNPELPIEVEVAVGSRALLLVVRDGGDGFDHRLAVARFHAGRAFYHVAGNGLRALLECQTAEVAWSDGGRTLHLLITR